MAGVFTAVWKSFWGAVWSSPWDFWQGVSEFIPPLPANLLQYLDGTERAVGTFVGDENLEYTFNINIPVGGEWTCLFETDNYIPTDPLNPTERIWYAPSQNSMSLIFKNTGIARVFYNSVGTDTSLILNDDKKNAVKFEVNPANGFRVTVNGSTEVIPYTIIDTTITTVMISDAAFPVSALLGSFSNCIETFDAANKFIGSLGTTPTITDPNNVMFSQNELIDKSGNDYPGLIENTPTVVNAGDGDRLVFNNEGTDYIDCGRPSFLDTKMRIGVDSFTVCVKGVRAVDVTMAILSYGSDDGGLNQQMNIQARPGNIFRVIAGGQVPTGTATIPINSAFDIVVSTDGNKLDLHYAGETYSVTGLVYYDSSAPLIINGRDLSSPSDNWEGQTWDVEFYEGYTANGDCSGLTPIEKFPLSDFTGGKTYGTVQNTECIVTDGTPITSQDKDIVRLRNTDLGAVLETEYSLPAGTLNAFLNRAELDQAYLTVYASILNLAFFITPNREDSTIAEGLLRSIAYVNAVDLDNNQEIRNDKHTGRDVVVTTNWQTDTHEGEIVTYRGFE